MDLEEKIRGRRHSDGSIDERLQREIQRSTRDAMKYEDHREKLERIRREAGFCCDYFWGWM